LNRSWKPVEHQRKGNNYVLFRLCAVRPFIPYALRHTFLTRLGESGCDVWTFARIAGHSNVEISQRYADLPPKIRTSLNMIS
jgi:site-specific recombinase XerD